MLQAAFELVADQAGTVVQEIDGEKVEVPKFQGGVLYTGIDGAEDFHLRDELDAGDGVIVVDLETTDENGDEIAVPGAASLVELLAALPVLKRCAVPQDRRPASGQSRDALRAIAAGLGLPTSGTKKELQDRIDEAEASGGDQAGNGNDDQQGS